MHWNQFWDKNWSRKIDRVNFQYNSIHMLLWYFLFFPHKQVVGSAECGKLFYMIDGLDSSIKSMFAGSRKSLWWGRRASSVCVRGRKSLFWVSCFNSVTIWPKGHRAHCCWLEVWYPAPLQRSVRTTLPRTWGKGAWAGSSAIADRDWVPSSHKGWRDCCSWCPLSPILPFSKGLAREG